MSEAIDFSALSWVREELCETLKQGRQHLEEYAEGAGDTESLNRCMDSLHEARGPLRMVDLQGADLLAMEMEAVVNDLIQGSIVQTDQAPEILMKAFLQLPDYLSRLKSGHPDVPEILLPSINELRALRESEPLGEDVLFNPDLSVPMPHTAFSADRESPVEDVQLVARARRHTYQSGLLDWYRSESGNDGLESMHAVLVQLQQASAYEQTARLWWLSAGLIEALLDSGLEATNYTRQLLGHVDRQIKQLIDVGETAFCDLVSEVLLKDMLFNLTRASGASSRVGEIRVAYGLDGPESEAARDAAIGSVTGCSAELLDTVSATALEELSQVSEHLDIFMRTGMQDATELESLAEKLHGLANTVAMIGLDNAGDILAANAQSVRDMLDKGEACSETYLISVADGMVSAQAALAKIQDGVDTANQPDPAAAMEFSEGFDAVLREVAGSMEAARERISEYLGHPENTEQLNDVPVLLNEVRGGLRLAGQEAVADLVGRIDSYITGELIGSTNQPGNDVLDTLADAICSVEFYVGELKENRQCRDTALDVARRSLARLGYPLAVSVAEAAFADESAAAVPMPAEQAPEETAAPMPAAAEPPVETTVKAVQQAVPDEQAGLVSKQQVIAEDADAEILEIFIEEAGEEIAALNDMIPRWQASPGDTEILQAMRRHFHTLKGSGRMVGAMALGEFAWTLENLLNRVIDGTVVSGQEVTGLLGEAREPVAQLLAQISEGAAVAADVDVLAARATALADGTLTSEASEPVETAEVSEQAGDPDVEEVPAVDFEPARVAEPVSVCLEEFPVLAEDADREIVEIFLEEAAEVLDSLGSLVAQWCEARDDVEMLESVRRAFHTLKGSGRMAGAMRIGEFAWVLENLLNRVVDGTAAVSDDLARLLSGISEPLGELLQQVESGTVPQADAALWVAACERLLRGESVELPADDESATAQEAQTLAESEELPQTSVESAGETDTDTELLEIFGRESEGNLETIAAFVDDCDPESDSAITDALYRALHTLTGTAESAAVPAVSLLAGDLYAHIGQLQEAEQPLTGSDLEALCAGGLAMAEAVSRLPDRSYDAAALSALRADIRMLSQPAERQAEVEVTVAQEPAVAEIEVQAVEGDSTPVTDEVVEVDAGSTQTGHDPFADMDAELLEIFIEEAAEIIDSSSNTLRDWSQAPEQKELLDEFQRQLHTLKGGARMVGIEAIGDLSHSVESLLTRVVDGHVNMSSRLFDLLQDAHDRLADMLEQVRDSRMPEPIGALASELDQLGYETEATAEVVAEDSSEDTGEDSGESETTETESVEAVSGEVAGDTDAGPEPVAEVRAGEQAEQPESAGPDEALVVASDDEPQKVAVLPEALPVPPVQEGEIMPRRQERRKDSRVRGEQVRVQSELLDNLVNNAGEINIYRSRMEQQLSGYRFHLTELDQTINRLRDQLRKMEIETETQILFRYEQEAGDSNVDFDPLEMDRYSNLQQLSRSLMESISDLHSIQEMLDNTTRESETLLLQQSRVSTDLQEGLLRTRMIPFASLAPRLRRIVRQSASELGKKVELRLDGADGEMDRTVIERIVAPLEHMLRNAVAHGIEKSPVRKKAGKPTVGVISIAFRREGPEIVLQVSDDGQGMNLDAIRERAIERDMMLPDASLPDGEVMQFILQTGFSTASKVTQIAGRGVGMDVVNSEVKQLGGSLHIDSKTGGGSVFTVRLPYTLAINQALLVRAGEDNFCIPLGGVESVVRVDRNELAASYATADPVYEYAGNSYQLKHLGSMLRTGEPDSDAESSRVPVLLVRIGEIRVALQVEALIGNREIVVKPLGAQLSSVTGVSGATILGDGRVVMILDLPAIVRMSSKLGKPAMQPTREAKERLLVMVVDDSITVRKVTTRLLERQGFEVLTAKDGIDAMGVMQDRLPDMMLLDIEMPRMDGFELASHMRNDERLRHIPITMITSRTGDKHRERARQIGIDHYLGKPYQEHELLETINRLVGLPGEALAAG
jgi:chemosensory pili system protein ChpA (sensor histidine kinase/response regulator)